MFCCSRETPILEDSKVLPYSWRTRQLLARDSPWQFWFSGPIELSPRTENARLIKRISCGFDHVLMLTNSGEVWAAGANRFGQCGKRRPSQQITRLEVGKVISPQTQDIAAGRQFSVVLETSSQVKVCGHPRGLIGCKSSSDLLLPLDLPDVTAVFAGHWSAAAVLGRQ